MKGVAFAAVKREMRRADTRSILLLILSERGGLLAPNNSLSQPMPKRLLLSFLLLCSLTSVALAEKNTVVLHPGDTAYVRFDVNGKKIRVGKVSKEPDDAAQVVFVFDAEAKNFFRTLRVENKFSRDLTYKAEMRSVSRNHQMRGKPTPVVAGKLAFDTYPIVVEELALFDFKLED